MTILAELRAEVQEAWQRSPTKTVLWLDPQREWERLLDQFAAELALVKYAGSQLELRVKIELEPAQTPRIVYVPLPRQALSVLKEYEFILPVWDEGLLHALRRWGVEVERDDEQALLPLLSSLAARCSDRPKDYWRHLTASGGRARLFDDEQVQVFLAHPQSVVDELERDGALAVFCDFLEEAFGVTGNPSLAPRDIARQLVQNLILTEAAERSSGEAFPFQGQLPGPGVRERCLRFLFHWLEARTQAHTAAQLLRAAEQDIPLGPWVTTLALIPDLQSSLQVERALVQRMLTDLQTRTSLDERAVLLNDFLPVFRRHAAHFWAVEGEVPEWEALSLAGTVVASASAALVELPDLSTAAEIVQAYVGRWWHIDRAYQRYRAGCDGHLGLDEVADTVRKLHRRYLEETTALAIDSMLDALEVKLAETFGGRVVRKDLVKKTKVGFNIPVYVLEYLLGRYCSSTDPSVVAEGLEHVKTIIAERFVRADEGELIKSRTRERGSMRLIDKVTVAYRETEDKYWASLANSGLVYVHIASSLVQQYEKLLVGGVWANVEIRYDDTLQHRGVTRPFVIEQLQPIQIASADLDEYIDGRRHFTRDEWLDVLFRSIGYEPGHADFTFRRKLLYLLRLVPLVEHNYNLVELGPRGTAYDYLRANLRRLGSDRDLKDFDLHIQIHSLMQAREGAGIGVAFCIALLSSVLARPLMPQLVILGDLTIHGVLMRVDSLADKLKTAMDAGAKKVMIPTESKRDFAGLPADIIDKLQIVFYSDPTNAAFRAMGLE